MDISQLREQFRPPRIRVLFIGESPPDSGKFFYKCDSLLFIATRDAFGRALNLKWREPVDFLRAFCGFGCYLDDLCHFPINGWDDPRRFRARDQGVEPLAARIREAEPEAIIPVMKAIEDHVRKAAEAAGCGKVVYPSLPFPRTDHRDAFISGLARIIRREGLQDSVNLATTGPPVKPQSYDRGLPMDTIVKPHYRGTDKYDRVRKLLIQTAQRESVITYHPAITGILGFEETNGHVAGEIGHVLGEISEDEHQAGRPMLSAVAVNADNQPGSGFFNLARELHKFKGKDELGFWTRELKALYDTWKK